MEPMTSDNNPASISRATLEADAMAAIRKELVRVVREGLGFSEAASVEVAAHLAVNLRRQISAMRIPYAALKSARDRQVAAMFNGKNHDDVMGEYNISRATFYRIIRQRERIIK